MKISVALCTYNGGAYLRQQIDSIVQQTHPPDEIVICDDGSHDETVAMITEMQQAYPAIHLIQNPVTLGYLKNFEQAIRLCSGDVIFISDQDDVWFPKRVETMLDAFEDGVSLVYSRFIHTDSDLNPQPGELFKPLDFPRTPRNIIKYWARILGCTQAFHTDLKPLLLPIPAEWRGHDTWIGLMSYILGEVRCPPEALMYYRLHQRSSSGNKKYNNSTMKNLQVKIARSDITFYTDERVRWSILYERLRDIHQNAALTEQQSEFLAAFLPEAKRRADFAEQREALKQLSRWGRLLPAFQILLRGDYNRFLSGIKTFGKDVLLT